MWRKLILEFILLTGGFAALWFGIYKLNLAPREFSPEISMAQEKKLGDLLMKYSFDDNKEVNKETVTDALDSIFGRLHSGIPASKYEYKLHIMESEDINAFTLPGGHLVVNTALIKFADSPEEVAAVLAHEIGHAEKRHVIKTLVREVGITVVVSILVQGDMDVIREISKMLISNVYSRDQETEADDFGLHLLDKVGIKPTVAATFFRKLNDEYSDAEQPEFLSTHPSNNKRIQAALSYKTGKGFRERKFGNIDWAAVKGAL
jgi:predicted Zn-dependent protease